ncbi:MAG: oxygen-independent coproporphyrinogen III oxidase [Lachnospiraceae bacterium]|nr:oxygen-independent coproporphyrinogen III oxidase [Lachnospiraceae bacterium]
MTAGIYVHIPFCSKKCLYCDFVSGVADEQRILQYHKALLFEITHTNMKEESADTLFFGGGTPSIYPVSLMEELMSALRPFLQKDNAEITLEANPGTLTFENLQKYRSMGFGRISMGLQSADNRELRTLGRIHTYEEFEQSYALARKAGFTNINIDIISAVPGQTFASFRNTLQRVTALNPEHISAYSLIVEEGTPFHEKYGEGKPYENLLPNEETDRKMYHFTGRFLKSKGFGRYEISNYARPGYECRHNLKYWSMDEYYGFGLSAASKKGNKRYVNTPDMECYCMLPEHGRIADIREDDHTQTRQDEMEEFMFLGLRKTDGISGEEFTEKFGVSYRQIYGDVIDRFVREGLLRESENRLMLTEKGIDVSNVVFAEFILR